MAAKIIDAFQLKDGRKITFRYPLSGDIFLMTKYINALSKEKTFIRFQGEVIPLEEERKYLEKQLERISKKQTVQLVAICNQQIVGISAIDLRDRVEQHIGIFGITLAKGFRGQGLGHKLMQAVIKEGIKKLPQLKLVTLEVYDINNIARSLYKSMGFKEYGCLPKGLKYKGKYFDRILMFRKVK
ncbi:GNAT family N-acetyltransferase [Candidatus Daviesbacteria bacterium]|nr:GNAT family N-acetyltransferase [Candidatus Daviesbacteria bacterium]